MNCKSPISIKDIENKFLENFELQVELHRLLNGFEALARGINQGVYDEGVVKSARKGTIIQCERAFSNYILKRRKKINKRVWIQLTDISEKWEKESLEVEVRGEIG